MPGRVRWSTRSRCRGNAVGGRAHAHHNPMEPYRNERVGLYRPRLVAAGPARASPTRCSTSCSPSSARIGTGRWSRCGCPPGRGPRSCSGCRCGDVDPGQQLITVIRKGTRALQQVPASPDAFVWLRLYQAQTPGRCRPGRDDPLWWTLRRPFRPLTYHAARAMFTRAAAALGANWTLHDLRHTAAYRMARDPQLPLTDVQWVLGHAHLSTTQLYLNARLGSCIRRARIRRSAAQRGLGVAVDLGGLRGSDLAI